MFVEDFVDFSQIFGRQYNFASAKVLNNAQRVPEDWIW